MKIKFTKIKFEDAFIFFGMWAMETGIIALLLILALSQNYDVVSWQNACRLAVVPGLVLTLIGINGNKKDEKVAAAKAEISAAVKKFLEKSGKDLRAK